MIHNGIAALFILLLLTCASVAQQLNKDSLIQLLSHSKPDSAKAILLEQIGMQYEGDDPALAKEYYKQSQLLSSRINYPNGILKAIAGYTYVLNMQGHYDSSLLLNKEALTIARRIKDTLRIAKVLFNVGTSLRLSGNFTEAVKYYEEGKNYFAAKGNDSLDAIGDDILQVLYTEMKQYAKSREHGERAVAKMRTFNMPVQLGITLNNLGYNYADMRLYDLAEKAYKEALTIGKQTNNVNMELIQYLNLGDIQVQTEQYDKLDFYFGKALRLADKLELHEDKALALEGLSYHYKYRKEYTKAKELAEQALALTKQYNLRRIRKGILTQLSQLAYCMQEPRLGNHYNIQATQLEDSLLNEEIIKNTQELEARYESGRKEAQIKTLQQQKELQLLSIKNKNMLITTLAILIVSAGIVGLLLYRSYRHRRKLQQSRIHELETEKQLAATEAVLKGEEQERARMAKDLHDGLGGMLSGLKYSLNSVRGNLIMTSDNAVAFERSLDMLDTSIGEMRRIAHNMLPEALITFGLDNALNGFCLDISNSKAITVHYQSVGMEAFQLEQSKAITVYRIVQELLSNILKHAGAQRVIVQLIKTKEHLDITVEDDGAGFNLENIQNSRGIGWRNIQNRVELLNGKVDIDTAPGRGTSVQIQIQL